jgi:hypothetical protein
MGAERELLANILRRLHDALHDWEKQLHHHAAELSLDELRVLRADLHSLQQKVEDEIERRVVLR